MKFDDYLLDNAIIGDDDDDTDDTSSDDDDEGEGDDVEEKGAGSRFADSIKGMLIGLLCFVISWPVLWCGARRTELGKEFKKALPVEQAQENGLAYVSGIPAADEIGDGATLKNGKYLRINKNIEYYAVKSTERSETKKKGTKQITTRWVEYSFEWTSRPESIKAKDKKRWKDFAKQNGLQNNIENPKAEGEKMSDVINTPNAVINGFSVPIKDVHFKGGSKDLEKVYIKGDKDKPKVGDKRISYNVYPSDILFTFSGEKKGKSIGTHLVDNAAMIVASDGDATKLLGDLKKEDQMMWWIYLIIGFILMAIGLNGMAGPITTLLDFIPFVGEFGAGLIRFVLTIVAAVLSLIFYLLVYYWWIVLIVVAAIVIFLVYKKKSAQPKTA